MSSYVQEQNDTIACCQKQRQVSLMVISIAAFSANRDWQVAKKQAIEQANGLRRCHLLKTVLIAWHTHLQVLCYLNLSA